ncbi:MAG: hypothetical protein KKC84_06195 [Candidatus Omnitrophica bacterium]|nr:hypothetical protein [Candidatus Omnitrophota bacterium]
MAGKDSVNDKVITLRYTFTFGNGTKKVFPIALEQATLRLICAEEKTPSPWAKLQDFQCPHCPLDKTKHEFCPIATGIYEVVDYFKDRESIEEIDLLIESKQREFRKHTLLQEGLSSLLGIYMVTTGCPVLEKLKPLVRFHLPFGTLQEATYRVVTMYLLAQFFLQRQGKDPDWDLKGLAAIYNDIRIVNDHVFSKIYEVIKNDAAGNALVKLNCSAFYIPLQLSSTILDEIKPDFSAYQV